MQNKLLIQHPILQPLNSNMAICWSSSKNIGKINQISILNKTSPWAHIDSELDMLGIPRKLVKYVIHSPKRINKKKLFFFTQVVQTAIDLGTSF